MASVTPIYEINFLPVCSNCRSILDDYNINIEYDFTPFSKDNRYPWVKTNYTPRGYIKPCKCPRCGVIFDCITMPTLPFKKGD